MLEQAIEIISSAFGILGIVFIIFGAVISIWKVLRTELTGVKKKFSQYEHIKRELLQNGRLGTIVIIRTVLSYFLSKEIHLHKE